MLDVGHPGQVTDHDIGRDTAHLSRSHLHREAASRKQTRPWTRCAMVAKGVQRAATTTDGNTRREGQAETAKQQQAEQVRLNARVETTALRPKENLLSVVQPGHQAGAQKWRSTRECARGAGTKKKRSGTKNGGQTGQKKNMRTKTKMKPGTEQEGFLLCVCFSAQGGEGPNPEKKGARRLGP